MLKQLLFSWILLLPLAHLNNAQAMEADSDDEIGRLFVSDSDSDECNCPHDEQAKTLHQAAKNLCNSCCEQFILAGAHAYETDVNGDTPLHLWARNVHAITEKGSDKICKLLVSRYGNVNAINKDGETPLHCAAWFGNQKFCELLIFHGAKVNITHRDYGTPLNRAACYGSSEVCKLLILRGADIYATNILGDTALHAAASSGAIETCKAIVNTVLEHELLLALIKATHNFEYDHTAVLVELINQKNNRGQTAYGVAQSEEIKKILEPYVKK